MSYSPVGPEVTVNSTYARSQAQSDSAQLSNDGKFVVVWVDADFNTTANRQIRAQMFGADGAAVGGEITLVY